MRKVGKILFLLIILITFVCTFSTNVKAANEADYSAYEELGGDDASGNTNNNTNNNSNKNTQENKAATPSADSNKDKKSTAEAEKPANDSNTETKKTDTATTSHVQAGAFQNVAFITVGAAAIIALCVGYSRLKKYNF